VETLHDQMVRTVVPNTTTGTQVLLMEGMPGAGELGHLMRMILKIMEAAVGIVATVVVVIAAGDRAGMSMDDSLLVHAKPA